MKSSSLHRWLIFSFLSACSVNCLAQFDFEEGYFIDLNGTETKCLIRNRDWYYNPSKINYKLTAGGKVETISTAGINEFVAGNMRYVRRKVMIDMSESDPQKLTGNREPEWVDRDLLLHVVVEGKATLYSWQQDGLERFFFTLDNSPIQQLVYKSFRSGNVVLTNGTYRSQLTQLTCGEIAPEKIRLDYDERSLTKYFNAFNTCSGSVSPDRHTHYKGRVDVRLTAGTNFGKLSLDYGYATPVQTKQGNFRIGVETEILLPVRRNKWAIMIEPTYMQFSHSGYESIEVPIGLRHIIHVSETAKFFINGGFLPDFLISIQSGDNQSQTSAVVIGAFAGGGFRYKRLSVELRKYFNRTRTVMDPFSPTYKMSYEATTLIFGLRLTN